MVSDNLEKVQEKSPVNANPDISIVIPAYNESQRLPDTLQVVKHYLKQENLSHEILVVDDGSRDNTPQIALSLKEQIPELTVIQNPQNSGKGFSVRRGMLAAVGNMVLMMDADQSSPIEELDKLIPPIRDEQYDIAIGSRALKNSQIEKHQPIYREPLGYIYNDIIQILLFKGIEDTQCGFKLFRRQVVEPIFSQATRVDGFAFDVEVLFVARKLGCRIAEIPIRWRNDPESKVKIIRHGSRMVLDLFRIRLNAWKGYYNSGPGE
jgi:dolichyl-phosphate beta-glucosyltransferase